MIERGAVVDAFGNDRVVEGENQLVIDQHILPALLVFEVFNLANQLLVVQEERPALGESLIDFFTDQALADKDFARFGRGQRAIMDAPLRVDHHAVKRRPLPAGNLHRLLFPMGVEVAALDQVSAHFLQPVRLDAGDAAAEETGRLGDLGRHDPFAGLFLQRRGRMDQVANAAGAKVIAGFVGFAAKVAEQAGEQGLVDGIESGIGHFTHPPPSLPLEGRGASCARPRLPSLPFKGRAGVGMGSRHPAQLRHHRMQLPMHLAPFTQAQVGQEMRVAVIDQLLVRFLVLNRVVVPVPQFQPTEKLGLFGGE